jgi:hypothetical protein
MPLSKLMITLRNEMYIRNIPAPLVVIASIMGIYILRLRSKGMTKTEHVVLGHLFQSRHNKPVVIGKRRTPYLGHELLTQKWWAL